MQRYAIHADVSHWDRTSYRMFPDDKGGYVKLEDAEAYAQAERARAWDEGLTEGMRHAAAIIHPPNPLDYDALAENPYREKL
jgi:hypothetical protein